MTSLNNKLLENRNLWIWGALALLAIYLLPLLTIGEDLQILVFDNLDSNVVWFKILAESGKIFASNSTVIPNMMGGLPRSCYGSEYNVILWLYYFFSPFQAYAINEILMHCVAFISMYIFLDRYLFENDTSYKYVYVSIGSLFFAILPFWPSGGLTVPLMPLVTYALLKIEAGTDQWKTWVFLILVPLYSEFILFYFFYFIVAGIYFVRQTIRNKSFNKKLFFALILVVGLFLMREYRVVTEMFVNQSFISDRTEYFSLVDKSFLESYRMSHLQFINGVPHSKGIHFRYLLPLSIYVLLLTLANRKLTRKESLLFIALYVLTYVIDFWQIQLTQIYTLPALLLFFIIFALYKREMILPELLMVQIVIAYWFGFSFFKGWESVFDVFPGMEMFNFSRFFFFSQFLWAVIVALVIKIIIEKLHFAAYGIMVFLLLQFNTAVSNGMFGTAVQFYHVPYNKFYATEQFEAIKRYIGKPQSSYRVISLGIEPAVSLYNGFYTLDGYMVNYPLEYKHAFRKIIKDYLEHNQPYHEIFDGWGSKVYLFDNGANYLAANEFITKMTSRKYYKDLYLNPEQIIKMGGAYLFSLFPIVEPEKYGLTFLKTFKDSRSMWTVTLYKVGMHEKK